MDFVDKISLNASSDKDTVLYDNTLSDEQKVILYNEIFKKQLLQKQPKAKVERKLLLRVWSSIENLPQTQQDQARDLIRKIDNFPNLTINPRFEMVYKDVPQHGTNIIQLILNHVSDGEREILPGQDLFENIAAYKERLVYIPAVASKKPARLSTKKLSKHFTSSTTTPGTFQATTSQQRNRKDFLNTSLYDRTPTYTSTPRQFRSKVVPSVDFSPVKTRSRKQPNKIQNVYRENSHWR